jgi:hypothetical protein
LIPSTDQSERAFNEYRQFRRQHQDAAPIQSLMTMLNEILRGYCDAQSRILSAGSG